MTSSSNWSENDGAACDDGLFCNGADSCDLSVCSVHAGTPCPDDGLWCNGEEQCSDDFAECYQQFIPNCPEGCDEDADQCEWCPEGGCIELITNADGTFDLEGRLKFDADGYVQGWGAFEGERITLQELLGGEAMVVVQRLGDGDFYQEWALLEEDGSFYIANIDAERDNFYLQMMYVVDADGNQSRSKANSGDFALEGELYACSWNVFSRTENVCNFLQVSLNSSSPSGVFSQGYVKTVFKGNLTVGMDADYTWVPAMEFRLVTSDLPNLPSPTSYFGFKLMSEDFQTTYGTGELVGDRVYITRSELNQTALGVGAGSVKTVVLVANVVGLPINTSFGFILMSVEATDYNGIPKDVVGTPLLGGSMTL